MSDDLKAALTEAVMVEMHRACLFLDDRDPHRTRHGLATHEARALEYVSALIPVVEAELARQRHAGAGDALTLLSQGLDLAVNGNPSRTDWDWNGYWPKVELFLRGALVGRTAEAHRA